MKSSRFQSLHLVLRTMTLCFLIWGIMSGKAFFFDQVLPWKIPAFIAAGYILLSAALLLWFFKFAFLEPVLIFLDFLAGFFFLFLYKGSLFFSFPFFLATYTAGGISWGASLFSALGGTVFFALMNFYFKGAISPVLRDPSWLFVLALSSAISSLGLFKAASQEQEKKMDALISLIEAGQQLGSTLTYEHVFQLTFTMTKNLFNASTTAVYLKDSDEIMKVRAIESPYAKMFSDFDPKSAKTILGKLIHQKTSEIIPDLEQIPESEEQVLPRTARSLRSCMTVPLIFETEVIGLLFVGSSAPRVYNGESLKLFSVLANQAAISLRNVQLHEKTATMAITDSVSGLYTHGYMQEALEREFRRCKYNNLPLSTIILDVDHFKVVNDTYGHPQGDALLRQLGAVIKTVTRASDIVCRYGGDEFMIILPETNRIGAVLVAERVRQTVEEYEFVLGSKIVHITISGGVASFPEDIETKKDLIDKTDQALYKSKQSGRNKISFNS